jgi:hypothetical protein
MPLLFLALLLSCSCLLSAQQTLRITGQIDGTDQLIIRQDAAFWEHVFGDLNASYLQLNRVDWHPAQNPVLLNSESTIFLTNQVNFLAARLQILAGRDTVVLQRQPDQLILSFADTPNGAAQYDLLISFDPAPTLLIEADIDGSDELHITYTGARWVHKHWGFPANVRLNGISWNPASTPILLNHGPTLFLSQPVPFQNAILLQQSGRDLLTLRPAHDGIIINFADNPVGGDRYSALIAFPASEFLPTNLSPVQTKAELNLVHTGAISVHTIRGFWYELETSADLSSNLWISTGSFILGNGQTMTLFDPISSTASKFYRVVTRSSP